MKKAWLVGYLVLLSTYPALAGEDLPELVKRIQPAVVTIITYNGENKTTGQGSGFFIDKEGHLVTSYHVIDGAYKAEIKTLDGRKYPVKCVVAEDRNVDLVELLIDIPQELVRWVPVTKDEPRTAERVVVVGSPLGLEYTVSEGIVSAVRDIPGLGTIFQTSAPMSPGSSGSPVVNMKGEVIGVATFQMIQGQNLNFAVCGKQVLALKPAKTTQPSTSPSFGALITTQGQGLETLERDVALGWKWVLAKDYEKALRYFKTMTQEYPLNAKLWFILGYCYGELGRHTEAIDAYKQVIRIKPDDTEPHFCLGTAFVNVGRYTEAINAFKEAIRIKPDYAEAHGYLGVVYGILGRYTEAIDAFKQAIRIKPDYAAAHCGLGAAYLGAGSRNLALEEYKVLKDLDKNLANQLFDDIYK